MLRSPHKKRKPKRVSSSQRIKQLASANAHKKRAPLGATASSGNLGKSKGGGGTPNKGAAGHAHGSGMGDKDRIGTPGAGLASRGTLMGSMGAASNPNYSFNESLAEKKAQQAVEEKLQLRQEIKEISTRVERMVSRWEEEESKASTEFPAQFAEAQVRRCGRARVSLCECDRGGWVRVRCV